MKEKKETESKLEQILASSNISLKVVFIDLKTGKLHKIAVAVCCSSLKFSLSIFWRKISSFFLVEWYLLNSLKASKANRCKWSGESIRRPVNCKTWRRFLNFSLNEIKILFYKMPFQTNWENYTQLFGFMSKKARNTNSYMCCLSLWLAEDKLCFAKKLQKEMFTVMYYTIFCTLIQCFSVYF